MAEDKGQILLYQTPDGESRIEVRLQDETVWLNLDQMAELFQRNKSTISRHIKNVFEEGELNKEVVVAKFATTTQHGAIMEEVYKAIKQNRKAKYSWLQDNLGPVKVKCKLLSSMFPQKIEFDGEKYRTQSYNQVLDLIFQETRKLREYGEKESEKSTEVSHSVPRPRIELGTKL